MIDRETIKETFLAEAEERLAIAEDAAIALEQRADDDELLPTLFRAIHTIKGDADSLGFAATKTLAHALEDLLERLRAGDVAPSSAVVTLILDSIDALRSALAGIRGRGTDEADFERELCGRLQAAARVSIPQRAGGLAAGPSGFPVSGRRVATTRIAVTALDATIGKCTELSLALARLRPLASESLAVREALADVERLAVDIQDQVAELRLVPAGHLLRGFVRTVRDLSAALGLEVRFAVEGAEVTVDGNVIEQLREPLTHLVRNALGHGIERPEDRMLLGKDPRGRLVLRAERVAGVLMLTVEDDGRGMDRERIRERAVERGMIATNADLSEEALLDLVFLPGFSTVETLTDLSGRGVGMDVVRKAVQALRGSVTIASRTGEGTAICLRVPVSLALIDGFEVGVSGERYVLPREAVTECVEMPPSTRRREDGVVDLRGEAVPFVRLRSVLDAPARPIDRETLVIVECDGKRVGLGVDELFGEARSLVHPLGPVFRPVPYLAGCTILESGALGLVVDVNALFHEAVESSRRRISGGARSKAAG